MAPNTKNTDDEKLAAASANSKGLREHLERNVWPAIPALELGRVMSREEDEILGYGPVGC
ncbi:hypothetical protein SBA3_3660012 [Candidatus Sulfopaludibacter sp. SbA3]|nr:hypothetical protein SBA3_3660012 [Candidatus Sulfopaludibacter sp. SbA3]